MTNFEIIASEAVTNGIFSESQIEEYLKSGNIPLKTFAEWKNCGFIVKRGQKARLKTKLWMLRPEKSEEQADEQADELKKNFILVPAYLFSDEQVTPIVDNNE